MFINTLLGARLAGTVTTDLQEKSISIVEERAIKQKILPILKIKILGETRSDKVIKLIMQGFSPRNLDLVKYSVEALNKVNPSTAVEILLKVLSYEYSDMSNYVFHRGMSRSAFRLAIKYSDVRAFAVEMLAKIDPELAVERLSQLIAEGDIDNQVRWDAAEFLKKIRSPIIVPFLLEQLDSSDEDIRKSVAESLGIIGSDQAVLKLIKSLKDIDPDVRFYAAQALGKIGSFMAVPALVLAMKELNVDVRETAAEALGKIGSDLAISALEQALSDPDESVRETAAISLKKLDCNDIIEDLKTDLIRDISSKYLYIRLSAAGALENLGSEVDIPFLLQALTDRYPEVRAKAALALGAIGSSKAIAELIRALEDQDSRVRECAVLSLGRIKAHAALQHLMRRLDDQSLDVRCLTIRTLGKIGSQNAVEVLIQSLKDPHSGVRTASAEALGEIASTVAVEGLLWQLDDPVETVRESVAGALAKIGCPTALPHLWRLWLLRTKEYLSNAIAAIQNRCKYYNHEIAYNIPPQGKSIALYFSSAPSDAELQTQLANHLNLLERQEVITSWHHRQMLPGDERAQVINDRLNSADIILLLISADSISDNTCYDIEINRAMERHQAGEARVIPILLRPVDWQGAPFSQLPMLPRNQQPVTSWGDRDAAFQEIAEGIRAVAIELRRMKIES